MLVRHTGRNWFHPGSDTGRAYQNTPLWRPRRYIYLVYMCKTASLNASGKFLAATFFRGIPSSLSAPRDFFGGIFCKTLSERYSVLSALQELADSDATET